MLCSNLFCIIVCCVFRPAFRCLQHLKAGWNTFFQPFSTFFVHFKPFSVISRLKSKKNVWKWTKKCCLCPYLMVNLGYHLPMIKYLTAHFKAKQARLIRSRIHSIRLARLYLMAIDIRVYLSLFNWQHSIEYRQMQWVYYLLMHTFEFTS